MNNRAPPVPPSPAESVASSETSETPSISDETSAISNNSSSRPKRTTTAQPIAKDVDSNNKERPPWRPVSVAVPLKPNKNALLKAKLLDASRRAMLLQKIANASTQTVKQDDTVVRTKMMRDIAVGQPVIMRDQSSGTDDITVVVQQKGNAKFRLTQSVGQMTEATRRWTTSTQTAMPRISLNFANLYPNSSSNTKLLNEENDLNSCIDPTFSVWDDLWDQPAERSSLFESSIRDDEIEKRLRDMHLYPVPRDHIISANYPHMPYVASESTNMIIPDLIYEANALLQSFQRVSMALGPKMSLTRSLDVDKIKNSQTLSALHPTKWDAVLEEACERLAEKINKLQ